MSAMKLKLNREFAVRHLFVAVLLAGLGCWFGYDGYVKYPSMTPEALYASCHNGEAGSPEAVARFHASAAPRQKQFMLLCLLGSAVVAFGVWRAWRFRFSYNEYGFSAGGAARRPISDIVSVDMSKWEKKGIETFSTKAGKVTLDAWHHKGVSGFLDILKAAELVG